MENKSFNLASHWAEVGASCQKICLKETDFRDLMVITKGWNPTRQFRLLEVRENRIGGESSHYQSYRRTADPYREYSDSFRLTRRRPNQLSSGFTPFRIQQISGPESPLFTITGSFQDKTRIQAQKARPPSARGRESQTQ
ncbi:hypothetical protein O181_095669 [Austropuccinia psidii MF-1]|uniref:Uncharacterized protein n=1 Tax=Austropuccinia psidii MF-1 TaxID=1389203 RepID=A0A9Q3J5S1_9BASI|nr:hypothetical protein [Austropuccinia psidii MF-1]